MSHAFFWFFARELLEVYMPDDLRQAREFVSLVPTVLVGEGWGS